MSDRALRQAVIDTALAMNGANLNRGAAGNISVRVPEGFLVTPSGLAYDACAPADIVRVAMDGSARGRRAPSSEWRFHRDIYGARPDAGAILHAHAPFATTLACLHRDVPAFHYMVAVAGGPDIRCAPYATFGTQELSDHAVAALDDRLACLLANHGLIVLGRNLDDVLARAVEVEGLCETYWRVLQAGAPHILDGAEMDRVLEKFKTYGQHTGSG